MAQRERLRAMLNERLASTGDGLCELFEGKIREYEEEVNFLHEESFLRQKLLDAAMKQDVPVVVMCEEDDAGPSEDSASDKKSEEIKPPQRKEKP